MNVRFPKTGRTKLGLFAAAAVLAAVPASAMTLVSDGDFNSPYAGSSYITYGSGSSFGGWTVTGTGSGPYGSAGVDLIGGYWQSPTAGGGSVDLDGNAPGGIEQTLTLTSGQKYKLSFYLSGNPDGYPTTKIVDVSVGIFNQDYTYTLSGSNSESNMKYTLETATFTAVGTSNTLAFTSLVGGGSPFGPVVGGVAVSAVPEPSTWAMMLVGFAGLGFAGYRKAKNARSNAAMA